MRTTNTALVLDDFVTAEPDTTTVAELADGDVFSVDGGTTWHVCCIPLFGSVAVYLTADRDPDTADTVRIDAEPDAQALVAAPMPRDGYDDYVPGIDY